MGITFCNKCNSLLYQKEGIWYCKVCNSTQKDVEIISSETTKPTEGIAIINPDDSEVLPKVDHLCQRCKCKQAYFWHTHGIGDEADTMFYRCTKCGLTEQRGGQRGGR